MKEFIRAVAGVVGLWLAFSVVAEQGKPPSSPIFQPPGQQVQLQRSADQACVRCHKESDELMLGKHNQEVNPNTNMPVTCTNCHGKPSAIHREGVADVMRFGQEQKDFTPAQQNSVCLSCHKPEELRTAFWAHDVHVMKQSCSSCHQLHPKSDPMQGLGEAGKVKLCVDCHSQLYSNSQLHSNSQLQSNSKLHPSTKGVAP
ncbi:MAG: cytochrome c nitrite reductase pentaheme subunit [Enterobacteriaceae bacterium]